MDNKKDEKKDVGKYFVADQSEALKKMKKEKKSPGQGSGQGGGQGGGTPKGELEEAMTYEEVMEVLFDAAGINTSGNLVYVDSEFKVEQDGKVSIKVRYEPVSS